MVGACYAGPVEDGEQVLRPLRASRPPLLDLIGPAPYVGFQGALDSTVVHGWNYYWKSTHLPELRDDLIDVITEHAFSCSSPRTYAARSEERRVGKEGVSTCRSRWSPSH